MVIHNLVTIWEEVVWLNLAANASDASWIFLPKSNLFRMNDAGFSSMVLAPTAPKPELAERNEKPHRYWRLQRSRSAESPNPRAPILSLHFGRAMDIGASRQFV